MGPPGDRLIDRSTAIAREKGHGCPACAGGGSPGPGAERLNGQFAAVGHIAAASPQAHQSITLGALQRPGERPRSRNRRHQIGVTDGVGPSQELPHGLAHLAEGSRELDEEGRARRRRSSFNPLSHAAIEPGNTGEQNPGQQSANRAEERPLVWRERTSGGFGQQIGRPLPAQRERGAGPDDGLEAQFGGALMPGSRRRHDSSPPGPRDQRHRARLPRDAHAVRLGDHLGGHELRAKFAQARGDGT